MTANEIEAKNTQNEMGFYNVNIRSIRISLKILFVKNNFNSNERFDKHFILT